MKVTYIEIEASATDLQSSNSVADGIMNVLRRVFSPVVMDCEKAEEDNDE